MDLKKIKVPEPLIEYRRCKKSPISTWDSNFPRLGNRPEKIENLFRTRQSSDYLVDFGHKRHASSDKTQVL